MILLFQIDASSLRQLSIVIVVVFVWACAAAATMPTAITVRATSKAMNLRPVFMLPPLCRTRDAATPPGAAVEGVVRDLPRERAGPGRDRARRWQTAGLV